MSIYKIILSFLVLATSIQVQAQNSKDPTPPSDTSIRTETRIPPAHLKYKGVEINGKKNTFFRHLEKKGFTLDGETISGPFSGFEVTVDLLCTPGSSTLYAVNSFLPPHLSWEKTFSDYVQMKNNLKTVYGEPTAYREIFKTPYKQGDGFSMTALKEGKADYFSLWETPLGTITIKIVMYHENDCTVMVTYKDKSGENLNKSEFNEILQNDL